MAQTLMAHLPGLARSIIMVPTGHFMHNPPWMAGTNLDYGRTTFMVPSLFELLKFYCILTSVVSDEPVQPPFKLRNSKCFGQWPSVQATIKGSDQTAHMRRLV